MYENPIVQENIEKLKSLGYQFIEPKESMLACGTLGKGALADVDVIVDIVETGTTLKENDLEVIDTIVDISARLIANKVSFKFKNRKIEKICADLRELIAK